MARRKIPSRESVFWGLLRISAELGKLTSGLQNDLADYANVLSLKNFNNLLGIEPERKITSEVIGQSFSRVVKRRGKNINEELKKIQRDLRKLLGSIPETVLSKEADEQ
jgi:hypothetical protein